jgi:lipid II:glycine glycyltransferase (peptidoglycan interpeptide bridge formation enzyme)
MKTDRTIRPVPDTEKDRWNSIATHPLQAWEWGEFRSRMGVDVVRLGAFEKEKLVEGWQITFHTIPHTKYCVGYFPKGSSPTQEMISVLKKLGIRKNALYIQLEPDVTVEEPFTLSSFPSLRLAHRPLFTKYSFILDLTRSEDEILAAMHSKTRYNIRLAARHGVTIAEDNSDKAFQKYQELSEETTRRQGFYAHNKKYHKTMWSILSKSGIAHCFTATYEKEIVTAWIVFVWKNTIYYPYGASSRNHKEVMAPNLLLWEIIKWAKTKGIYYFDLWGAMGPNPDTKDSWYGFHRFKEGYAPLHVEYIGSYDLVIHSFLYSLFTFIDSIRWMILKIQSKL